MFCAANSAEHFPFAACRGFVNQPLKAPGAPAYKAEGRRFRCVFEQKTGPCRLAGSRLLCQHWRVGFVCRIKSGLKQTYALRFARLPFR